MWVAFAHFFSKTFQHICIPLDVNYNESLTNDVVSFEQLGPVLFAWKKSALSGITILFKPFHRYIFNKFPKNVFEWH